MRRVTSAVCAGLIMVAGACGGGGGDQGDLANEMIESAKESDVELDEDCVRDVAAKFSDADTKLMLDNIDNPDAPDLSPEGDGLLFELFNCAEFSDLDISTGDFDISAGDLGSIDVGSIDVGSIDVGTIDQEAFDDAIEAVIANLPEGIDKDCFREAMQDVDPAQLASGQSPEFVSAMTACLSGG